MRSIILILLIVFIIALPATLTCFKLLNFYPINWIPIANIPNPVTFTAGTYSGIEAPNGKFYVVCGEISAGSCYPYLQILNTLNYSWSTGSVAHPTGGISHHSVASRNYCLPSAEQRLIVSGGKTNSGYYNYTTIYDTNTQSWTQSTPMPVSNMVNTAMGFSLSSGKYYLFGGQSGLNGTPLNSVYEWTPGDTAMVLKAPMPAPRINAAVVCQENLIYVFGGSATPDGESGTNTIWIYNPNFNSWNISSKQLVYARTCATASNIGDLLYIVGGKNGGVYLNSTEMYYVSDDSIFSSNDLPYNIACHASGSYFAGIVNSWYYAGNIFIAGGKNSGGLVSNAERGTAGGGSKIEPTSLGNLKALYH